MAEEQNEYGLPVGKGEKRRTARLLPRYYRTEPNKKFIQATIDQLTQSGTVKKLNGYIGRQNAKAVTGNDVFIETVTTDRQHYQLEPAAVVKDTLGNVTFFKDYIDYVNTVDVLGGVSKNHQKLNKQEFYSWNPHINWDKIVNFQQYYWLPYGPTPVKIVGQQKNVISTYKVQLSDEGDNRAYLFTPDGLTRNPTLKLYRGQTYRFEIDCVGEPFSIKTTRVAGELYRYTDGIDQNAIESGVIEFTVPDDAPNVLYYVSENSVDTGGAWEIFDITDNTSINVETEILKKKTYTLSTGLELSNGMKVTFTGEVTPELYSKGNFYVEGVGTEIKLIPEETLEIITSYSETSQILFDDAGFDSVPFADASAYASKKDYITINRSNTDGNPWSRYNRWFHQDVIVKSAKAAGLEANLDQTARATRPIIEFESNLKLFNFGTVAKRSVDLIDKYTKDVFSDIEGSIGYIVDGVSLTQNQRILFTADEDPLVNNRIFRVDFITVHPIGESPIRQIHLVDETDSLPNLNETVLIRYGENNQGLIYWYNGTTWVKCQEKLTVNQSPLFDLFDENGVPLNDPTIYSGSTFAGNKIFSYKQGTSSNDTVLGFPLSYRNINNIGDIVFTFDLLQNEFSYKQSVDVLTSSTDSKFLKIITGLETGNFVNGWTKNTLSNVQPIVRIYKDSGLTKEFNVDVYDDINNLSDLEVRVYVNGKRLSNTKWSYGTGPRFKKIILDTPVETTDIVTLKCFSAQDKNANGYYELPNNFQNNPLNANINTFTLGEVIDHVDSIIDNNLEFSGSYPGSGNLRDLGQLSSYGTKFVQHSGPLNLGLYHLTSKNSNVIKALKQARDEYGKFKRNFVKTAKEFVDISDVKQFVDNILFEINKDKAKQSPYYFSDMIGYGASTKTDYTVVDYRIKTYPLSAVFTLDTLSVQSVNVYVNGVQLLYGKEYTFNNTGFVEISPNFNLANDDVITVYEYDSTDGCFVPPTPTSFGLWPKFEPKKYLDTTLVTPQYVIQGHDGSIILAYNDYRDDLILELEKRIFNNIKVNYDPNIFDILDFIPGYNRTTDYTLDEFNKVLAPNFYQWTTLIDRDFTKPLTYTPSNEFTYNYRTNFAPDGRNLPGYWRGIYTWLYDTDRIHLCPWESLGYSMEPEWWEEVYGSAPYTSNNFILWDDIKNGIIREPGKPVTRNAKFAKPIIGECLPVDEAGNLVNPVACGIPQGTIQTQSSDDYVFGDVSPVENAWRRSSFYPFSVIMAAALMQPNKVLGTCIDRSRIIRSKTGQLVYKDTGLRIKLEDIVLPSIPSDNARIQTAGLVNYLVDYILSDNLKSLDQYKIDLATLTNQLSHRLGGFTSKEKFNLILDSKSPTANAGVFVPKENYSIFLNTSSPTKKLSYSGVIVSKVRTRTGIGYEVKGYGQNTPFFYYYPWSQSGQTINVGGISESYINWTGGQTYIAGNIVKYNNIYYRVKTNHTAQDNFNVDLYQKLASLPVIGGRTVILRKAWSRIPEIVNYGTTYENVQDVVDFLQGYGEYLKDQGFVFDDYNTNLKAIASWETSIKEFAFWTTQNWSAGSENYSDWMQETRYRLDDIVIFNGEYYKAIRDHVTGLVFDEQNYKKIESLSQDGASVIALSPSALGISMKVDYNVIDDIRDQFNEYEIFKADGFKFDQNFLNYTRDGNEFAFSPRLTGTGIYGAGFFLVQKEHVLIIDNTTQFNDTIYNLEAGYRQERIKVSGYRTTNWYGGFDVPGFIFDQAKINDWTAWVDYNLGDIVKYKEFYYSAEKFIPGVSEFNPEDWIKLASKPTSELLPNWDYKSEQFTDFYDLESDNFDAGQQKIAQHLIGYQKRQYLENIIKNDVSEYKFYQGMIPEKGSNNVLNKLFDVLSAADKESISFNEEWALRVGQYGGSDAFEEVEFVLDNTLFKTNPQAFELVNSIDPAKIDFVIRQTPSQLYIKPVGYNNSPWPVKAAGRDYLRTPGHVRYDQISINIDTLQDVLTKDITTFKEGDYVWCAYENALSTDYWNIYRFTPAEFFVTGIQYNKKVLTIEFDKIPSVEPGDIIGITNSDLIQGFHTVATVNLNVITINVEIADWKDPFQDSAQMLFYKFVTQRFASIDADVSLPKVLRTEELIWLDDNGSGKSAVWKNTKAYTKKTLNDVNSTSENRFGRSIAVSADASTLAVSSDNETVVIYTATNNSTGWVKSQNIVSNTYTSGFGESLAFSPDSVWLAIGTPSNSTSAGVVSMYKIDSNGDYQLVSNITSQDPGAYQYFGSKIKLVTTASSYKMLVTQPGFNSSQGRVYAYEFISNTWAYTGAIPTTSVAGDAFGYDLDVSNDGEHLVISSPNASSYLGKVYVYTNNAGNYTLSQTLTSGSSKPERYGESVSVTPTGDLIAVGSITYDDTKVDQGIVRVYKKNSSHVYTFDQTVKNRDPEEAEAFGARVQFINDGKSLVIFSALGDSITVTTFDGKTTTFDKASTRIATVNVDVGRFDVYDRYSSKFVYAETLPLNNAQNDRYGYAFAAGNNTVVTSAILASYNNVNSGAIYTYVKDPNVFSWQELQVQSDKVDLSKIKKVFLYNRKTNELISYLDVIDPIQGKIAGIAEQEIKYKTYYDPATYSYGTANVNVDDGMSWTGPQVGTLWWDLTRAKFLDSYNGDVVYKNATWNTLYETSSIDVYEWVESKLLPSAWDAQADTEAGLVAGISGKSLYGDTAYSVKRRYDTVAKSFKNTYYFWVKNKTIVPNVVDRSISAKDVASLISDPKSQGHKYIEFTSPSSFSLINVESLLHNTDIVLAVQYWLVDHDDLNIHTDWKLVSEHPNTSIPATIERKWIDSLVGVDDNNRTVPDLNLPPKQRYGIQFRPRQSMFVNRLEALKQYIERVNSYLKEILIVDSADLTDFDKYDPQPSYVSGTYDVVVDTESELRLINTGSAVTAVLTPTIVNGVITSVTITNSGSGYGKLKVYDVDSVNNPISWYGPNVTVIGSGTGAIITTTIDESGRIISATVVSGGSDYSDSTTLTVRNLSALVKSDSQAIGRWSIYAIDDDGTTWNRTKSQSYDVTKFRNYIDWYATGYNQFTKVDYVVDGTYQLFNLDVAIGQVVKVKTVGSAGWMLLEKYADVNSIDYTLSYKVVGRQNGTIEISNRFYQFTSTSSGFDGPLFDADTFDNSGDIELKIILTAIKDKILIDDLRVNYLQLFFASLKYALAEQTFVDWAFKTSFVKAMHNVGELKQKVTYNNDNLIDFESYISEVKPYRTKVREYVSSYTNVDNTQSVITDFDLPPVGRETATEPINVYVQDGIVTSLDPEIQEYPWKHWLDNVGFKVTEIKIADGGSGYISKPVINIVGDATVPATARAYIAGGKVTKIELLTNGSGYLEAPTIEISGGLATDGVPAKAVAIIKNDLIRSNYIKIKFDRISKTYFVTSLDVTETFTGTGSRLQWPLKWSPDLKIGNTIVTVDGQEALRDTYKITTKSTTVKGHTSYYGMLTFTSAPNAPTDGNPNIQISYIKDFNYLNAADRINFYYDPVTGQLGKDLSQLMSGVDYGGVNIIGLDFKSSAGWDALPWLSDVWDGFDPTFDDYIVTVGDSTYAYTLPYTPEAGQEINVYVNGVRIDDPYFNSYDGSTEQPNGRVIAPPNAVMQTFVGDGVTNVIELPNLTDSPSLDINSGDQVIFRKSTSDGASTPSVLNYDTSLTGGNIEYTTATGLAADDIIVDGDGFITPTSSPATEEVVPGHIFDTVAIKVFHRTVTGSAGIMSKNYIADGATDTFVIGQYPNTQQAVIVKVDNVITTNFTVDYDSQTVTLGGMPTNKAIVNVTSFGFNGTDIEDLDYFVGDGSTSEFITRAPWADGLSSLVLVSGGTLNYVLFRTDETYDDVNKVGIRFATTPAAGAIINYVISSSMDRTYSLVTKETFVADGSTSMYPLTSLIGNALPYEANIIVRAGNEILSGPNNTYYTLSNNELTYTIPAHKFQADNYDIADFKVYLSGNELTLMTEYIVDLLAGTITINGTLYAEGATLIVSILPTADYFMSNNSTVNVISFVTPPVDGTHVEITSFYNHDLLDIKRSNEEVTPNVSLTQGSIEALVFNRIKGGVLVLDRAVLSGDYVWIIKNGTLLTHAVDYKLLDDKASIKLSKAPKANDMFDIMTFTNNIVQAPIGYMQFKDILNRDHYKRMNRAKQTTLAQDLHYYDKQLVVDNGTILDEPNRSKNLPGILYVNGERIEYFVKSDNVLSQLRRGTLGTGVRPTHPAGTQVLDIGASETIPYNDQTIIDTYVHDGSTNMVPLQYVPTQTGYTGWTTTTIPSDFGPCDEIDVFVGGWKIVPWEPGITYSVGEIVFYGSYTFKCGVSHTSSLAFVDDRANWEYFVGNQRLIKHPYAVHNVENHYESSEGDVNFEADFSVDGATANVRLTNDLTPGTKVVVVKKVGRVWTDPNTALINSDNKIANFIKSVEGVFLPPKKD